MRKLIGKGTFTKVYQISETEVEVITTCPTKEMYAMFSQGRMFAPKVTRNYDKENAYFMPLYPKVKAVKKQLNEHAYNVYRALQEIHTDIWKNCKGDTGYHRFCHIVEKSTRLTEEEKENIIDLAGDVCNNMDPDDMRFEISPRNITFDEQGNLILLDCFFSSKVLHDTKGRA